MSKSPHAWLGYRRDARDPRDREFSRAVPATLPASVDLRRHCPPVMDQGAIGSCTANAITGALRFLMIRAGRPDNRLSRLQLYYDERKAEGSIGSDSGAEIRDGIKCAAKIGVGRERLWPYRVANYRAKPPAAVYADAVAFNALQYERVAVDCDDIKHALALGFPVVVGVTLFNSFDGKDVAKTGIVPMPDLAHGDKPDGGHCMYVVGYGQKPDYFTVRNSWGASWGDHGDCYMPEAYLGSKKYGGDYWLMRGIG
jgi:C1A family cysteine protease